MSGLSELTWAALQARVVRLERDLGRAKASAGRLRESAKKNKPVIQDLRAKVANRDARIAALEELLAEARSGAMRHGLITCDICGATGAKTCYFYVDRKMDAAGSMDDVHEPMDLCDVHQWAAYQIAEKRGGFEVANHVYNELSQRVIQATAKRKEALSRLPVKVTE